MAYPFYGFLPFWSFATQRIHRLACFGNPQLLIITPKVHRDSLTRLFQEKPKPSKGDLNKLIIQYLHEVRDYHRKSMIYAAEAKERKEEYVAQLAEQEKVIAA
jgi:hypothetical protein